MAEADVVRRLVRYAGRVQGVGFRFTARSVAARYPIAGYVKNLPDGRVEVLAEGPAEQVEAFLADLQGTMGRYIRDVQESVAPAGPLRGFEVRF